MLDVASVILIVVFAGVGFFRGILYAVLSVGAIAISYPASKPLAAPVTTIILNNWDIPPAAAENIARVATGLLVLISLLIAARLLDKHVGHTKTGMPVAWNRNLGALVGLVFGVGVVFCLMRLGDALYKAYPEADNWLVRAAAQSRIRGAVSKVNPADRLQLTDTLKFVRAAADDPEMGEELLESPEVKGVIDHPTLRAALEDKELMEQVAEAAKSKDLGRLREVSRHEKIRAVLNDRELRTKLLGPGMRARIAAIVEKHQQEKPGEAPPEEEEKGKAPASDPEGAAGDDAAGDAAPGESKQSE